MKDLIVAVENYNSSLPKDESYSGDYCNYVEFEQSVDGLIDELVDRYHESGSNQIERWVNSCDIDNYDFPSELRWDVVDYVTKQVRERIKR